MAAKKRSFSKQQKKEVVEALLSGKKDIDQIVSELKLDRFGKYQVLRWRDKYLADQLKHGHTSMPAMAAISNPIPQVPASPNQLNAKDLEIALLKAKLYDMEMALRQVDAERGYNRRAIDKLSTPLSVTTLNPESTTKAK